MLWETKWDGHSVLTERLLTNNPRMFTEAIDESPAVVFSLDEPDYGVCPDNHPRIGECTHVVYGER